MRKFRSLPALIGFLFVFNAGVLPSGAAIPGEYEETLDQMQKFSDAFAAVAAEVQPGVVAIFSEKVVQARNPFQGGPFDDPFFRRFFQIPEPRGEQRQQGLGSGVIVSEDGYILTNNHVIDEADKIRVEMSDKRSFEAKVVGTDPKSDVAVLKIDGENLPVVRLGDSNRLKVGQWVLAIGNPFGLQHTVTYGIVSAIGRGNLRLVDYEDFIQTDAAINPGNSGGAMVNLRGELVGINTAIVSRSGGYQGVGFAIPVNMARGIMEQLVEHGRVSRGFLGVMIQDLTPEMADALGIRVKQGAIVSSVQEGTPAERAGLKQEDVIVGLNGEKVTGSDDLRNRIAQTPPDTEVRLKVLRDGREKTVSVKLGELDGAGVASREVSRREEALGWEVQELTGEVAQRLGYDRDSGVLIANVQRGSVADRAGLQRGDLILEINRKPVRNLEDYASRVGEVEPGGPVLLLVRRGRSTFFAALRLPE